MARLVFTPLCPAGLLPRKGEDRQFLSAASVPAPEIGEGGGQIIRIVGALGAAIDAALHAAIGHRRHVGQPDQHRARGAQPGSGESVLGGDHALEGRRTGGDRQALGLVRVLGGIGDAVERTKAFAIAAAAIGSLGLLEHVRIEDGHGVERDAVAVVMGDAPQVSADQLNAGDGAFLQRMAQVGDRGFDDVE